MILKLRVEGGLGLELSCDVDCWRSFACVEKSIILTCFGSITSYVLLDNVLLHMVFGRWESSSQVSSFVSPYQLSFYNEKHWRNSELGDVSKASKVSFIKLSSVSPRSLMLVIVLALCSSMSEKLLPKEMSLHVRFYL